MDETQDTIDGLLAEFREHAAGVPASCYVTMSGHDFHKMLDRFDAARKRESDNLAALREATDYLCERMADMDATFDPSEVECLRAALAVPATTEKSSVVGDCAKLREALATIRKRLVAPYESEAGFVRYSPNRPLVDLIDAALAAPPRNCDKFGTDNCEATVAYEDYCEKCGIAETADDAISWLLRKIDPLTEGGAT